MNEPTQEQIDAAAVEAALRQHRTEEGARLAFAEALEREWRAHEARVRAIQRRERLMYALLILSALGTGLTVFVKLRH